MNIQMRIITDDNVDQLMSMSYSKNIMELTKNVDVLKGVSYEEKISENESKKELEKMNDFVKNYINYMNMRIRNRDNEMYNKEQANLNDLNEIEPKSFEIVFPETPETLDLSNNEEEVNMVPTTPEEAPPFSLINEIAGPTTPDESPPPSSIENNNLEIDFGTKEYNDFYESLPINSKKMIMGLSPKDRVWVLKKTKLLKERKLMEEAQQQEEQQQQQQQNEQQLPSESEKKNLLEYTEDKQPEPSSESSSSSDNVNIEIKTNDSDNSSSSSNSSSTSGGVKKIIF
jgi:hypothetical protein